VSVFLFTVALRLKLPFLLAVSDFCSSPHFLRRTLFFYFSDFIFTLFTSSFSTVCRI